MFLIPSCLTALLTAHTVPGYGSWVWFQIPPVRSDFQSWLHHPTSHWASSYRANYLVDYISTLMCHQSLNSTCPNSAHNWHPKWPEFVSILSFMAHPLPVIQKSDHPFNPCLTSHIQLIASSLNAPPTKCLSILATTPWIQPIIFSSLWVLIASLLIS
jgi:hypothetical protein